MYKRFFAVILAVLLAASVFIYAVAEESGDTQSEAVSEAVSDTASDSVSDTSSGESDTSSGESDTSSEESEESDTSSEESETSSEESDTSSEESEPAEERAYAVASFSELREAIADGRTLIELTADITFGSAITLPTGLTAKLIGEKRIGSAAFTGSGSIDIEGPAVLHLTVNDAVTLNYTGDLEALDASGDCDITITGNITGRDKTAGITAADNSIIKVNGSVTGGDNGFGDGIYLSEKSKVTVTGDVTGGSSGGSDRAGYGVRFSNSASGEISVAGSVQGGKSSDDVGGSGIVFAGSSGKVDVGKSVLGGEGKNGGVGAELKSSASLTVAGSIVGGSGDIGGTAVVISEGTLKVDGRISGGKGSADGGCGLDIRAASASEVSITVNDIYGGDATTGNGGDAVKLACVPGSSITIKGKVLGGDSEASRAGAEYYSELSDTIAIQISEYDGRAVLLKGSFSFVLYSCEVSGTFDYTYLQIEENSDDCFEKEDTTGYFLYQQYNISGDAQVKVGISEPSRKGKNAKILLYNGTEVTTVYSGSFEGTYSLEEGTTGICALYIQENEYTVTVGSSSGGSVSPSGERLVREGDSLTISIAPSSGYVIDEVRVGGVAVSFSGYSYTLSNLRRNTTIFVQFKVSEAPTSTVTVRSSSGGTVSPLGEISVKEGDSFTVTMTANEGYYISQIRVDGTRVSFSGNTYTISNVTRNHVIAITFSSLTKYSVIAQFGDGGTVTPDLATVFSGGSAKFVVTPEAGYEISRVSVDYGTLSNIGNIYTVSRITRDTVLTVVFKRDSSWGTNFLLVSDVNWTAKPLTLELLDYTVISAEVLTKIKSEFLSETIYAVGDGYQYIFKPGAFADCINANINFAVRLGTSGHDQLAAGRDYISVSAASIDVPPSDIIIFLGHSNTGTPYSLYTVSDGVYSLYGTYESNAGGELTVPFAAREFVLVCTATSEVEVSVQPGDHGTADPAGTVVVQKGSDLTVKFTADSGWMLSSVKLNGEEIEFDEDGSCTVSSITEAFVLTSEFVKSGIVDDDIKVRNDATIVLIVFGAVLIVCASVYIVLRRKGIIKYKKEL